MTQIVAQRALYAVRDGHVITVSIEIHQPELVEEQTDHWVCPVRFISTSDLFEKFSDAKSHGQDSVQSLTLALQLAGVVIDSTGLSWSGFLSDIEDGVIGPEWFEDGFPRPEMAIEFHGSVFKTRIREHVSREKMQNLYDIPKSRQKSAP